MHSLCEQYTFILEYSAFIVSSIHLFWNIEHPLCERYTFILEHSVFILWAVYASIWDKSMPYVLKHNALLNANIMHSSVIMTTTGRL